MQVYEYKEFRASLVQLRRHGGAHQRAAEKAMVIMDDLKGGPDVLDRLPVTNHGESRIKKAVKYDLTGACRLVTIQDSGFVFLCFVGDHADTEKWIDSNRGLTVRVDAGCKPLVTFESIDITVPEQRIERDMGFTSKPILSLIDESLQDALLDGLPRSIAKRVESAMVSISDDEIEEIAGDVENQNQKEALFDALIMLRADDAASATRRVQAYTGALIAVEEATTIVEDLADSSDFQYVRVDSEHYRRLIEHFARSADYRDWMLFMHPDQQRFVHDDYAGPTKLSGVSGSGKTCIVVRRAIALAEKYPAERVLILTLNRSLSGLIAAMVEKAALPEQRDRIDVLPFFRLCQSYLARFEPGNDRLYDDVTWKMKEHIDEVWREFYRCELNNSSAKVLLRLHDSLIARGIDAESYIREEFDWIRSACDPGARASYLRMERTGRTYPLDESFRRNLLEGLACWEDKMRFVGITDYLGIANALYRHVDRIEPTYRCVLIDESQDFGTVELQIVRRLVQEAENDVFLCGDAAQQVSFKHQSLSDAGVGVPGARSHRIELNYRNSREILELAHGVLVQNLTEAMIDAKSFEVLDPQYANFSGPTPLLLRASDFRHELHSAIEFARSEAASNAAAKVCVCVCGYSEHELAAFARRVALPLLDGAARLDQGQVFLSDLENTKGFEFQIMIIVNCSENIVPCPSLPSEEAFRDLSRLYVAMTRARQQLVVSYTNEPSSFLVGQRARFAEGGWEDYFHAGALAAEFELPPRLEQIRGDGTRMELRDLTGAQYLYTEHALGCSPLLVEKLRSLIGGKSIVRRDAPAGWRSIGDALRDTALNIRSRQAFGPEGYVQFRDRFTPPREQEDLHANVPAVRVSRDAGGIVSEDRNG